MLCIKNWNSAWNFVSISISYYCFSGPGWLQGKALEHYAILAFSTAPLT